MDLILLLYGFNMCTYLYMGLIWIYTDLYGYSNIYIYGFDMDLNGFIRI